MQDEGSDDMQPAPRPRRDAAATRPRRANAGAKGRGWSDEASWESSGETGPSESPLRRIVKRRAGAPPLEESSDEVCHKKRHIAYISCATSSCATYEVLVAQDM